MSKKKETGKDQLKVVQLLNQKAKGLKNSKLQLELSGSDVTISLVNTLRTTSINDVPTYAFCKDSIIIEKNNSIFDNDSMRLRLEQLTVPDIEVPVTYLEDKYSNKSYNYADPNRERHPDDNKLPVITVNKTNKSDNIINVTTNDVKYYENGELKKKFDKEFPLLIIKLRPGETFNFTATAVLGCGKRNNIWAASGNSYHEYGEDTNTSSNTSSEEEPHQFKLTVESQGQIDEYTLLQRSCDIIKQKLNIIFDSVSTDEVSSYVHLTITGKMFELKLDSELYTIGTLINEYLQMNTDVEYSGVSKPDLLKTEVVIKALTKKDPIKCLSDTINTINNICDTVKSQLIKLSK